MARQRLTEVELRAFIAGNSDADLLRRIAEDYRAEDSQVKALLRGMHAASDNCLQINWGRLVETDKMPDGGVRVPVGSAQDERVADAVPRSDALLRYSTQQVHQAVALGGEASPSGVRSRWSFSRTVVSGSDAQATGIPVEVVVAWTADGELTVRLLLLAMGPGTKFEATWRSASGVARAADGVEDGIRLLRLRPADRTPPGPTDRFVLSYTAARGGGAMSLAWEETFGPGSTE